MSAYIMHDTDLYALALYCAPSPELAQELANALKRVNIKSVNYRYRDKTRVTKCKPLDNITFNKIQDKPYIKSLIQCWGYQSCEDVFNLEFHTLEGFLLNSITPKSEVY